MVYIRCCDARQMPLKDGVVQCVVISPPYWGLRDYVLGASCQRPMRTRLSA